MLLSCIWELWDPAFLVGTNAKENSMMNEWLIQQALEHLDIYIDTNMWRYFLFHNPKQAVVRAPRNFKQRLSVFCLKVSKMLTVQYVT